MKRNVITFFSKILIFLLKFFKIKLFKLNVGRIGHLVELFFLYNLRAEKEKNTKFLCYLYYSNKISNKYLFNKFKKHLNIIPYKIGNFLDRVINSLEMSDDQKNSVRVFDFLNKKSGWEYYNGEILDIQITKDEETYFKNFLKDKNIRFPYVCINLWSFKHLKENYPGLDWSHHDLRLSNDENFTELINYITEKKMNVVIMGHDPSRFKKINNDKVFNYPSVRDDILDVLLIKNCYCYISDSTGLDYLAFAFKRPMLLNSPFLNFFFNKNDKLVYLLKSQFNVKKNRTSTLNEMLYEDDTLFKVKSEFYKKNNIIIKDNNSFEILDAYKNLDFLIKNNYCEKKIEKYSEKFWNTYKQALLEKNFKEKNHYKNGPYPYVYNNIELN